MKSIRLLAGTVLYLAVIAIPTFGQVTNTNKVNITGQWDFDQGDLRATIGAPLQYLGDIASLTTFQNASIGGATAKVMSFPAAAPGQGPSDPGEGYLMYHGAKPNGNGTNVNQYTLIMDILLDPGYPWHALFTTDTNNQSDATMFVNPDNAIGVDNDYAGDMEPNVWYRLGLVFDLPNGTVTKYLNGTNVGSQFLGDNLIDSPRFSLGPALLLFTDESFETGSGKVNSIQFRGEAATDEQMAALGSPGAGGIAGGPGPGGGGGGDVEILSITRTGTTVTITASGSGTLQLQKKVKLTDAAWQDGPTSTNGSFTVTSTETSAFFRVKQL